MCYFYLLKSKRTGKLYKGQCHDLYARLKQHNSGKTKSTRNGKPWIIIYFEQYKTIEEAIEKERYYKSLRGAKELKKKVLLVRLPEPETSSDS